LALSFPASEKRNHTPILVEGFLTTPVKLLEDGTTTSQEVVRPDHPRAGAEFSGRSQRTPAKDMMPSILRQIAEAFAGS
jgi:hypothetical protein